MPTAVVAPLVGEVEGEAEGEADGAAGGAVSREAPGHADACPEAQYGRGHHLTVESAQAQAAELDRSVETIY